MKQFTCKIILHFHFSVIFTVILPIPNLTRFFKIVFMEDGVSSSCPRAGAGKLLPLGQIQPMTYVVQSTSKEQCACLRDCWKRICKTENVYCLALHGKSLPAPSLGHQRPLLDSLQVQERTRRVLSARPRNDVHYFCPYFVGQHSITWIPSDCRGARELLFSCISQKREIVKKYHLSLSYGVFSIQFRREIKIILFCFHISLDHVVFM